MTNGTSIIKSNPLALTPVNADAPAIMPPALVTRVDATKRVLPQQPLEAQPLVSTSRLEKAIQGPLGGLSEEALDGFSDALQALEDLQSHPEAATEIDNIGWELEALVQDIDDRDLAGIVAKQCQYDPELNQQKVQTLLSRIKKLQSHAKEFKPRWDTLLQKYLNRFDSNFAKLEADAHTEHFPRLEKILQKAHRRLAPLVTQEKCFPEDPGLFADLPMPKSSPRSDGLVVQVCSAIFPLMQLTYLFHPVCNAAREVHAISLPESTSAGISSLTLFQQSAPAFPAHQKPSIASDHETCPAEKKPNISSYEMGKLIVRVKEGQGYEEATQAAQQMIANGDNYRSITLFSALIKKGQGIEEATQAAKHMIANGDEDEGVILFRALIEKGQGIEEAIQAAKKLTESIEYKEGIKIFKSLIKKGQGIEEAIQAAQQLIANGFDLGGVEIFSDLIEEGQGFEEAIQAAEQFFANGNELGGDEIFRALFKKEQGFKEAREALKRQESWLNFLSNPVNSAFTISLAAIPYWFVKLRRVQAQLREDQAQLQMREPLRAFSAGVDFDAAIERYPVPESAERGRVWEELTCPLTRQVFFDPVRLTGHSQSVYERKAIMGWLKNHGTDPKTGHQVTLVDYEDANDILRKTIQAFRALRKKIEDVDEGKLCTQSASLRAALLKIRTANEPVASAVTD